MTTYHHLRIPLLTLLSHPKGRASLKAFALAEHSEETVSFIEDVEALRELYPMWNAEQTARAQRALRPQLTPNSSSSPRPHAVSVPSPVPAPLDVPDEEEDAGTINSRLRSHLPSPTSPQSGARSLQSISLFSPLQRHSLLSSRTAPLVGCDGLREFTFTSQLSSPAHSVRVEGGRGSLLNAKGDVVSAVSVVNESASKIWAKYQPHAQFAISWDPAALRDVQAEIRRGGGRIESPLVFNGQEDREIENVQGGTLTRYYATKDYRRLVDDLLTELALSVYSTLAASASLMGKGVGVEWGRGDGEKDKERDVAVLVNFEQGLKGNVNVVGLAATRSPRSARAAEAQFTLSRGKSLRAVKEAAAPVGAAEDSGENSEDDGGRLMAVSRANTTFHPKLKAARPNKINVNANPTALSRPGTAGPGLSRHRIIAIPSDLADVAPLSPVTPVSPSSRAVTGAGVRAVLSPRPPTAGSSCSSPTSSSLSSLHALLSPSEAEFLSSHGFFLFHFNPLGSQLIRSFMQAEYSVDNYDFLLAVDQFSSRAMDERQRRKEAKAIYQTFLSPNSKREVTFPSDMRADLHRRVGAHTAAADDRDAALDAGLFDGILDVVLSTVRTDVFRRFLRSPLFGDLNALLVERWNRSREEPLSPSAAKAKGLTSRDSAGSRAPSRSSAGSVSAEEAVGVSFNEVLADEALLSAYVSFCKREHSEENVLFYVEARRYASLQRGAVAIEEVDRQARAIHAQYVASDAPFEVHLPPALRASITSELNFLHPEIFQDAVRFVVDIMRKDSGKRFLRTPAATKGVKKPPLDSVKEKEKEKVTQR